MKHTFRILKFQDARKFISIIEKTQVTKRLNDIFKDSEGLSAEAVGQALITTLLDAIVENYENVEHDLAAFYADLISIKTEDFLELPIDEAFEIILAIREVPNFNNFLNIAQKLLPSKK